MAMQKCEAFQDRLANLVIRLACQSPENAAVLVRPVLLLLQQRTAAAAKSLLSETDVLQVVLDFSIVLCLLQSQLYAKFCVTQKGKSCFLFSYCTVANGAPYCKLVRN
jgi:hypothetical protein